MTINQDLKALNPYPDKLIPKFLMFFLIGVRRYLSELVEVAAHGTRCFRTDMLMNVGLPLVSLEEQDKIVTHIETIVSQIDSSILQAEKEITLIKEYQQSLISEAVTGKIDLSESREP